MCWYVSYSVIVVVSYWVHCFDEFCCFCHRFYPRLSWKWLSRQKGNDPMFRWVAPVTSSIYRSGTPPSPQGNHHLWIWLVVKKNWFNLRSATAVNIPTNVEHCHKLFAVGKVSWFRCAVEVSIVLIIKGFRGGGVTLKIGIRHSKFEKYAWLIFVQGREIYWHVTVQVQLTQ